MNWGGPGFVLALIAMSMIGWVVTTAIRAKHGYPLEGEWGGEVKRDNPDAARQARLMAEQNEQLTAKVLRLEERIAVLERIATDPATRTAREIDALR
ncbi:MULTISPECIES: hypothetical protein [unclassified Sphingomonas]|uniref:hypothetical protein n=1 Tax=unclassified Sphingomonas TaxID=196159 RepID=UPI000701D7F1|nr:MULTISPECIES: hypothetical protein [unclassified Sphingomonas]KQM56959.1 hypothetical protein ASE65_13940 [Sphingomonas sp. Leaf16]KQN09331.1 hypothetical protein ASE81_13985 [Sphingomonas sp. Leaf29]KQN17509.1 hypothetical protein ASE83_13920 [Sphingomonas sp. Leaf32]